MISGFNTDVECAGTVYHVQTEDKGAPHHVIMSLVYDKGTILASKREPYDIAVPEGELKERLDKQHKLICAAVKAGRIDDLRQMTAAKRSAGIKSKGQSPADPESQDAAHLTEQRIISRPVPADFKLPEPPIRERPAASANTAVANDVVAEIPIVEAVVVDEYPEILPADVVEVVSELSGRSRPSHNNLGIELIGEERFRSGDRKTLCVMVCRGSDRNVVPGAQIMIKLLGASFRPVIFHARSDQNGLARIHLQVPQFSAGRAALLIRAIADGEEVELRRLVAPAA